MTDTLDNLREMYKQYIIDLDCIMLGLNEAIQAIPSNFKKINVISNDDGAEYKEI
jgi:hypothetical protein